MNTKTNNKDFSKSSSLENQESNEVFNGNANSLITALINHKDRCGEKTNNSIKQTQLTCPLPNSKYTRPSLIKEEMNKLAKAWCELLLGQIQEVRNQPVPLKLKPLKI